MTSVAQGKFAGKRLVVFGAGYIGGEVAREGVARGMRVTALTRNPEKAARLRSDGVEVVEADLAGSQWHDQIAGGADYVLNSVSSGGGGFSGYQQSYLEGMRSILAWAGGAAGVGTFVYTSSTSVYGDGGGAHIDETAVTGNGGDRAAVLVAAEDLLRASHAMHGDAVSENMRQPACDRWFILRLAGIYGPSRHHLIDQVRAGAIAGKGDHHLNLAHRDDICASIWSAFAAPAEVKNEIINVADDAATTKAEITAWLAERLGLPVPGFTGEPAVGRRAITPDRIIVNAKLKRVLGWAPKFPSYRDGYGNLLSR